MNLTEKLKKTLGIKKEEIFLNEIPYKEGDVYKCYNLFLIEKNVKIDLIRKDGSVILDIGKGLKLIADPKKIQIQ